MSLSTTLLLGLLLGIRHALEPDHLAAVSTLIARRRNQRAGAVLGASWGVGHSIALITVGCVLSALHATLPGRVAHGFELLVALMLLLLGTRAIARARVPAAAVSPGAMHQHDGYVHAHAHAAHARPNPRAGWRLIRQPLAVGLVHGLGGSGTLTALVMADMPTPTMATRLAYMALFGTGSILGMSFLTGIVGWPLVRFGGSPGFTRGLSALTGTFSVLLGSWWGWTALRSLL